MYYSIHSIEKWITIRFIIIAIGLGYQQPSFETAYYWFRVYVGDFISNTYRQWFYNILRLTRTYFPYFLFPNKFYHINLWCNLKLWTLTADIHQWWLMTSAIITIRLVLQCLLSEPLVCQATFSIYTECDTLSVMSWHFGIIACQASSWIVTLLLKIIEAIQSCL